MKINQYAESERGKFARYDHELGWDGLENAESTFNRHWTADGHAAVAYILLSELQQQR